MKSLWIGSQTVNSEQKRESSKDFDCKKNCLKKKREEKELFHEKITRNDGFIK